SDVLQEAFTEAARKLPEYAREPKLPLYLWLRHLTAVKLAEVLALKRFEQPSTAEIAAVLSMSKSGAGSRYLGAVKRLREILATVPGFGAFCARPRRWAPRPRRRRRRS